MDLLDSQSSQLCNDPNLDPQLFNSQHTDQETLPTSLDSESILNSSPSPASPSHRNIETNNGIEAPGRVLDLIKDLNYQLYNPANRKSFLNAVASKYPKLKWDKKSAKWPHNCFEQGLKADNEPIYICKACVTTYKHPGCTGGGAGSSKYHAERCPALAPLLVEASTGKGQMTLNFTKAVGLRQRQEIEELFVHWNASSGHSFHAIENPFLRAIWGFFKVPSPLPNRKTLKEWMSSRAGRIKLELAAEMHNANTKINLCLDAWTSPFNVAFLGIIAHYIDKDWVMQERMLAFIELTGGHAGHVTSRHVFETLEQFGITERLGTITTDNASDNGTFVASLSIRLLAKQVEWNSTQNHLRCVAHIVNLSAQCLLSSLRASAPEVNDTYGPIESGLPEVSQSIVSKVIGQIRKLVKFICSSPQREQQFFSIQQSTGSKAILKLVKDVATRWNSTYFMIERFVRLREALDLYIGRAVREKLLSDHDRFTEDDWDVLAVLLQVLQPFEIVSRRMARTKEPTVQYVWPCYLFLFSHLERWPASRENRNQVFYREVRNAMEAAHTKLKEYYQKTDDVPWFGISCILDPFGKLDALTNSDLEPEEYLNNLRALYKDIDQSRAEALQPSGNLITPGSGNAIQPILTKHQREEAMIWAVMGRSGPAKAKKSEIDRYLEDDPSEQSWVQRSVLEWWRDNETRFPSLSSIARGVLSQVASSVSSERCFNMARDIHNYRRGQLDETTISDLVLIKYTCAQSLRSVDELAAQQILGSQPIEDYIETLRAEAEALEDEAGYIIEEMQQSAVTNTQKRSCPQTEPSQQSFANLEEIPMPIAPRQRGADKWVLDKGPVRKKRKPFQETQSQDDASVNSIVDELAPRIASVGEEFWSIT